MNISNIENPKFLREINSLLLIKYLKRNAVEIIITNGLVSLIIEGTFRNGYIRRDYLDNANTRGIDCVGGFVEIS